MPVERRKQVTRVAIVLVNWLNQEEPAGCDGRRQPSMGGTSRVSREAHARFCEGLGVKFPGPTRRRSGRIGGFEQSGHVGIAGTTIVTMNKLPLAGGAAATFSRGPRRAFLSAVGCRSARSLPPFRR